MLGGNLLEKNVKRPFCCAVSILQVYFTYLCYLLVPGISFYRKNQIIDQCSFHIDSIPFTLQTMIFRYNYKSNDVFYSPN